MWFRAKKTSRHLLISVRDSTHCFRASQSASSLVKDRSFISIGAGTVSSDPSPMEITGQQQQREEEEEEPFLKFIDYARSILIETGNEGSNSPGWSWIASRILKSCIAYSSGVTPAILLSDLSQAWSEQIRGGAPKKSPECIDLLKKKHKRVKLPCTVTIDSIHEKRFLSLNSIIQAVVLYAYILPGTNIYMLSLGDFWSSNTIDLYLHQRFYKLADPDNGILKKGREVFLTGCCLRTVSGGPAQARLLPTEYFVVLLDEDQDDDAMLLGAQFCSDSFSSISLDAVKKGVSYSLFARIESIGSLEIQGRDGTLQRKQIALVDNDGFKLTFLLWGEQVLLANLLSVGSMLALDRPFIASSCSSSLETSDDLCLEYGSATQLYLVPLIQHEEQVSIALSQSRSQGSRLLKEPDLTQGPMVSQVMLPCDSQGSIDFSYYPFRSFVVDLRDKMTGISLYGVVTHIIRERNTIEDIFSVKIKDTTGTIWIKLQFCGSWSLGRLNLGHTVFVSGLSCCWSKENRLHLSWREGDTGASFVNISCLPALLNSSCLHRLSQLSDLSRKIGPTHICQVWLDQIEHCHVNTRFLHSLCGHFVEKAENEDFMCNFCNHLVSSAKILRTFDLKITLADGSSKVFAWCSGQTAAELLQITPDEFDELPEEEQIMYPSSLENERFIVALVNSGMQGCALMEHEHERTEWEITRAMKV